MRFSKKSIEQQIVFFYLFSVLIRSGVPIVKVLKILFLTVSDSTLRKVIQETHTAIQNGDSISTVFSKYSNLFSPFIIELVRIGEKNGNLDNIFKSISKLLETKKKFTKKPTLFIDQMIFFTNLSILIDSGLTIATSLSLLGQEIQNRKLKLAVEQIRKDIEAGTSVYEAFSKSAVFPEFAVSMLRAGEVCGDLDTILPRIAEIYQKMLEHNQTKIAITKQYADTIRWDDDYVDSSNDIVKNIFREAIKQGVSSISIKSPEAGKGAPVIFYVGGRAELQHNLCIPEKYYNTIVAKLKIMANLDFVERKQPQKGEFKLTLENKELYFKIQTLPTDTTEEIEILISENG